MKTITYYHKNSDVIAYEKIIKEDGYWNERTYDENGNMLTYKNSNGSWNERTYDENGNELTYRNSDGYWSERTYDEKGNELTFKDSYGNYKIKGREVIKEEFEVFTNPLVNKITE